MLSRIVTRSGRRWAVANTNTGGSQRRFASSDSPRIIFEDHDFWFCWKPANLASRGETPSLTTQLQAHVNNNALPLRVGFLHALDKVSSGIVPFSKNNDATKHYTLMETQTQSQVSRVYAAVVKGTVKESEGLLSGGIMKSANNNQRFSFVKKGGVPMKTRWFRFKDIEVPQVGTCSVICLRTWNEKRHQARASCSALGTPVLGDSVYGGRSQVGGGVALVHAAAVSFQKRGQLASSYSVFAPPEWPRDIMQQIEVDELAQFIQDKVLTAPDTSTTVS